jgi:hypothetical protein
MFYYVNKSYVKLVKLCIPLGIALSSGFFLESLAMVKNLSVVFLAVGLIYNYWYPEIIIIEGEKLKIKLSLAKNYKEYLIKGLKISVEKRACYYILHLDRKYYLEINSIPRELYYQLKPYIKII